MARPRTRPSSVKILWWLAGPALLLAALYAWLSGQPVVPPEGATVFYPAIVLYYLTATALAVGIALAAILAFGMWLPLAIGRQPKFLLAGLPVILALGASGLACWGTLPQTFTPYRHLDRATLGSTVYQLGLRAVLATNEYSFVLCRCDASGLTCHCRDLAPTSPEEITAPPKLVIDPATNTFQVQVGAAIVHEFSVDETAP